MGLSRLGEADNSLRGSGGLQVALAGAVGSDTLGSFFAAQAAKAGVAILADVVADSSTGITGAYIVDSQACRKRQSARMPLLCIKSAGPLLCLS